MCCIILPNIFLYTGVEFSSSENRQLQEKPSFKIKYINDYPTEYTSYYEDNMPFKDFLVKCNAYINVHLFKTSPENAVILGKDGWLFYNSKYKEGTDTLEDYIGSERMNESKLEACKDILLRMQAACHKQGSEFILMIAPNKMSVYGEYMPDKYYKYDEKTTADILVDYLKNNTDLKIVYPKESLLLQKNNFPLYYKLDSHWNELGGYIGYSELYETILGEKLPPLDNISYTENTIYDGDLARMLSIDDLSDTSYNVNYYSNTGIQQPKLLMYRDSFTTSMEKYLAQDFPLVDLQWTAIFDQRLLMKEKPDYVVYELVERSIRYLPELHPIFTSTPTESVSFKKDLTNENTISQIIGWCPPIQENEELILSGWGFIPDFASSKTSATVYLVGDTVYEAPIRLGYRCDIAELYDIYSDVGYSDININLDISNVAEGEYKAFIVFENDGKEYSWNLDYIITK